MARYIDRNPVPTGLSDASTRRSHHDVVVVGARCAGAATARLLARAGHDVVMVDRSHPASDTSSTHSLSRGGVVQLAPLGAARRRGRHRRPRDPVRRLPPRRARPSGTPSRTGPGSTSSSRRGATCSTPCWPTPPWPAGARLVTDTTVTGVLRDAGGRVIGVTARDADGTPRELMARLVIGADGLRSSVARYVGAQVVERHDPTGACFYTYVGEVDWDGIQFHLEDDAFAGVFPTHHGEACVWLIRPVDELAPVMRAGADRAAAWLDGPGRHRARAGRTGARRAGSPRRSGGTPRSPTTAPAVGSGLGAGRRRRLPPRPDHRARHHRRVPRRRAARRRRGRGPARACRRGRRDGGLRAAARRRAGADLRAHPGPRRLPPARASSLELQARLSRALDAEALALADRPVARPTRRRRGRPRPRRVTRRPINPHPPPQKGTVMSITQENHLNGVDTATLFATIGAVRRPAGAREVPVPHRARLGQRHPQPGPLPGLLRRRAGAHPRAARPSSGPTTPPCSSATTTGRPRPSCCSTPWPRA